MKIKKILKIVLLLFAVIYVLLSPNSAAGTLRVAGQTAYQGVMTLADSAAKFFDALLRH